MWYVFPAKVRTADVTENIKSIMAMVQGIAGLPLSSASLFLDRVDDPLF